MRTTLEKHSRYIEHLIQKITNLKANAAFDMLGVQCMAYGCNSKIIMAAAHAKHLNKFPIVSWNWRGMVCGGWVVGWFCAGGWFCSYFPGWVGFAGGTGE